MENNEIKQKNEPKENIKVLWIDDECFDRQGKLTALGVEVTETAGEKGIDIMPESSFEKGVERIRQNPKEFCAVILDVRKQNAVEGGAADDYAKARREIERMQDKDGQYEPYIFVLSGEKDYQNKTSPIPKMGYCSRRVYDKNGADYELLFEDILKLRDVSPLYKTQCEYSDVLKITKELLEDKAYNQLLVLIYQILTKNDSRDPNQFNAMRKFFETHIMSFLKKNEHTYFLDPKRDKDTMNELSCEIGKDKKNPIYIRRAFHTLVDVIQDGSHGTQSKDDHLVVDKDVRNGRAPYLLRSCLFELLNIIVWLKIWVDSKN